MTAGLIGLVLMPMPDETPHSYRITVQNLTMGQPLSVPVAATTHPGAKLHMFKLGNAASRQLAAVALNGDQQDMALLYHSAPDVTDVADGGRRLTPKGVNKGGLTDTVSFTIKARSIDRLSLVAKLVCTNDGFAGVNEVELPAAAGATLTSNLFAYDAGVEQNTEHSEDIVDGCVVFGPEALRGKPNGNDNSKTETRAVAPHPGLRGDADLDPKVYGWAQPVARLSVQRLP